MTTTLTSKSQVTIHKAEARANRKHDRFEAARGKADVKWRTADLMALLRGKS